MLLFDPILVVFDNGVAEELAAKLVEGGAKLWGVGGVDLEGDRLAHADLGGCFEAEAVHGVLDGCSLRIEDAFLGGDVDDDFHAAECGERIPLGQSLFALE